MGARENCLVWRLSWPIVAAETRRRFMKMASLFAWLIVVTLIGVASAPSAPVESVESARTSVAFQKLDAFLDEQLVVEQLASLGLCRDDARQRLSKLSDSQIEEL